MSTPGFRTYPRPASAVSDALLAATTSWCTRRCRRRKPEAGILRSIAEGRADRDWVDAALRDKGVL